MSIHRIDSRFEEWDALLALILDAFAYMKDRIDPPSSAMLLTVDALKEKAQNEIGFVARIDTMIVGCIFCRPESHCLYIGKLAVSTQTRQNGIGRLLLNAAIAEASRRDLPSLRLQVRIELSQNHARFAKWGFVETARSAHAGYDRMTSIEMRRPV